MKNDLHQLAERQRAREWQGEVATPRVFVKQGEYTGADLRSRWRHTIWDTMPSRMSGKRYYRDGSVETAD